MRNYLYRQASIIMVQDTDVLVKQLSIGLYSFPIFFYL